MAHNTFATNDALTKKAWEEKLLRDVVKENYFSKFMSEKGDNIVHVKSNLEKTQGDNITYGLRMRAEFEGVTGSTPLEGNENDLDFFTDNVSLEYYRIGIKTGGRLDRKRVMFSIDSEAQDALKEVGTNKIEQLCFNSIFGSYTRIAYKTGTNFLQNATKATVVSALDATNSRATPGFISALKTYAKTGGNRSFVPLRPVKISGKDYWVLLVHPDVIYDLKQDAAIKSAWEGARERDMDNPLFRDAEVIWDGVVVHSNERVPIATNGGAGSVAFSEGVMLGAQALMWAWGEKPFTESETFDYKDKKGYSWNMIAGVKKPVFNSQNYGSIGAFFSRTNVSGA